MDLKFCLSTYFLCSFHFWHSKTLRLWVYSHMVNFGSCDLVLQRAYYIKLCFLCIYVLNNLWIAYQNSWSVESGLSLYISMVQPIGMCTLRFLNHLQKILYPAFFLLQTDPPPPPPCTPQYYFLFFFHSLLWITGDICLVHSTDVVMLLPLVWVTPPTTHASHTPWIRMKSYFCVAVTFTSMK